MQAQQQFFTLTNLISARHSCRSYRPDPVPRDHIEKMLDAARLAPSSCNQQPWRFAVVTRPDLRETIVSRGFLPGMSLEWVSRAPVLIVMGVRRSLLTHRIAPLFSGVDYAWIDLGIAGEHLVLQATELGLGTCWIGWIRPGAICAILGWPRDIRPAIVFTAGWPETKSSQSEASRLPASDIVQWYQDER